MTTSIGSTPGLTVRINERPLVVVQASDKALADAPGDVLAVEEQGAGKPVVSSRLQAESSPSSQESGGNTLVQTLQKRMKELQALLQKQQEQLAAAQAASYPAPETKATVVAGIQGQIASTSAALMETAAALAKELGKGSTSGGLVNTTA
ncbi:hypothetical protein [Pseudomonas sp. RA_35y_Pfl2_P32]|uniref:hypothetical protein n=1 Tax=Pseudomonas sp. RA_35y_Pfl2_P32 TaxID=3088705 RepID=UPI0030DD3100